MDSIYKELSNIDKENSEIYLKNAQKIINEIDKSVLYVENQLSNSSNLNFIVFHDAYQYFESYFEIFASGSIILGDASSPTPSRLVEIDNKLKKLEINCAFSEPQYSSNLVDLFGTKYNIPVRVIDPLGSELKLNKSLYPDLLKQIGERINSCNNI